MKILYPYNEILPRKKAHDVYIVQECGALAEAGCEVSLLCGQGSVRDKALSRFYHITQSDHLHIQRLPIIRKNNAFNISWNLPFFWRCQKEIKKQKPNVVLLSVRKQGEYHLKRKQPNTCYLYEVHELTTYPGQPLSPDFKRERDMLAKADLITVTTHELKKILLSEPYTLQVPIEVVPLAVNRHPLPPIAFSKPLHLTYVGQLYKGQGIELLLDAIEQVEGVHLKVIGGKPEEVTYFSRQVANRGLEQKIAFLGFYPPSKLNTLVVNTHAFIAPFENSGRMPYVAHTKLCEYAQWGRPILAPDLPVVREHFTEATGTLLFEPNNPSSLAAQIQSLLDPKIFEKMQSAIATLEGTFTWTKRAKRYQEILIPITGV